jgi:4-hydroxy-3-methylbut-2-enyl diphosphate reductase
VTDSGRNHDGRARLDPIASAGWLPDGPVTVGLTAGASTPNNVVGEVVERLLALRGRKTDELVAG